MKYIEMKTNKGKYRIPLVIVATNRTEYYAENDGFEKDSQEWKDEMDFVMSHNYEGIDWLTNNMYLSEIKPFMEKIEDEEDNDDWFFDSDNFEIISGK